MTIVDEASDAVADLRVEATVVAGAVEIDETADQQLTAAAGADGDTGDDEPPVPPLRAGLVVGCSVVAAAVLVSAIFEGPVSKVHPALAGVGGIVVAVQAARRRTAVGANLTIAFGILGVGLVLLLPSGIDAITGILGELRRAAEVRQQQRPPAEYVPGFRAIVGWLMAALGFTCGWLAVELRRPAFGLLAPLPVVVIAAISVPASSKLGVGLAVLVLFVLGFAQLSSLQSAMAGDGDSRPPLGYELRRVARLVPLLAVLLTGLVVLTRSNLLFPPPLYDPVRDAQRPKAVPLSQVEDRVLFEVRSRSTGPWRLGLLDVYDGEEWRIPAFAESALRPVPSSGIVEPALSRATRADFLVKGLSGAVLPGLPGTAGISADGPKLAYDGRTGTIRLAEGQVRAGLSYTVAGAALPEEPALLAATAEAPQSLGRFLQVPPAPPAVARLVAEAPTGSPWARLAFVRRRLLESVTASGPGIPVAVPPERVDDLLVGGREGSPFEIVAAQALLARWVGVPARIGYGYDGGEVLSENVREVRPRHGASWLEVSIEGFGWFPVIGSPLKAKPNLDASGPTNQDPTVEASDQIAAQLFVPLRSRPRSLFYDRLRGFVLLAVPALAIVGAIWVLWPLVRKLACRSRRRSWAARAGPVARIQVAYAELRDLCTDLGVERPLATPLRFLDALAPDVEHIELAWLVTRALYGDLRDDVTPDDAAAAEELARSLRARLRSAQPVTFRMIAAVSRLSLRTPYAADVRAPTRGERRALATV